MPTPSDDTVHDSPPTAISVDPRSAHTCPPEEDREPQVTRSERTQHARDLTMSPSSADSPEPTTTTPDEPETDVGAAGSMQSPDPPLKHMDAVEEALMRDDTVSSSTSEESKDNDARLAHSMSATAISPSFPISHSAFPSNSQRVRTTCNQSQIRC